MTDKILPTHAAKRIRELLIQIGDLEVLCAEQQDEIDQYEEEAVNVSSLISDYQYLQARNETLEKENERLAEQIGDLERKVNFFTTRNDSLAGEKHQLSCDNQYLTSLKESLERSLAELRETIKDHEENERAATQTILNLDNDLTAKDTEIEDLQDDHQELVERGKALEEQNDELREENTNLRKESFHAEQTIINLEKIIKAQGEVHQEGLLRMVLSLSQTDPRLSVDIESDLQAGRTVQTIKNLRKKMKKFFDVDPGLKVCLNAIHAHPSYRPNPAFFGEIPASYFEDPPDED